MGRFFLFQGQIVLVARKKHGAKTGAMREALPFPLAVAFALVCFGNNKMVGLIIPMRIRVGRPMFCALNYQRLNLFAGMVLALPVQITA